jgi:hypothetical protein
VIVPYTPILITGSRRYLPFVTVQVLSRKMKESEDIFALVDSGSEHSIFRADVADSLGLSLANGEPVIFGGYGEEQLKGVLLKVDMQVELGRKKHRWRAPVIFSEKANKRQVLGQEGFFEYFDVEFRRRVREFEIRKSRRL